MVEHCLACGQKKTDFKSMLIGMYFICAWVFAMELLMTILQIG